MRQLGYAKKPKSYRPRPARSAAMRIIFIRMIPTGQVTCARIVLIGATALVLTGPLHIKTREGKKLMAQQKQNEPIMAQNYEEAMLIFAAPTPKEFIKQREGWRDRQGNQHMVSYVEWHYVADLLDEVWPSWSHQVRSVTQIGDMVVCVAALTIAGITREGCGTGTADNEMGIKKAEHDALKRAAVKFGIARDLYQNEEHEGHSAQTPRQRQTEGYQGGGYQQAKRDLDKQTQGRSDDEQITVKQLNYARSLARELGKDVDVLCSDFTNGQVEEADALSKQEAKKFIDWLKQQ